jgi:hypothetical protein
MNGIPSQFPDVGEDRKFVTPRMDGDLVVPIILGDQTMLVELFFESLHISSIIDPLLKFSDEARSQRIDPDPSMAQGDDEKQVVFRGGRERGFVDGDFEIEGGPVSFLETDPFVPSVKSMVSYRRALRFRPLCNG